jgi:general secretion pathway protein H
MVRTTKVPIRLSRTGADGGYTLVELLVVLAVIGLIILSVPTLLTAARPALQAKAAARLMAEDMSAARQAAVLHGVETGIVLNAAAGRYAMVPGGVVRNLPKGVIMAFRSTDGNAILFYPDGSSTGGIVLVGDAGHQHRIIAHWLSGRISLDE